MELLESINDFFATIDRPPNSFVEHFPSVTVQLLQTLLLCITLCQFATLVGWLSHLRRSASF